MFSFISSFRPVVGGELEEQKQKKVQTKANQLNKWMKNSVCVGKPRKDTHSPPPRLKVMHNQSSHNSCFGETYPCPRFSAEHNFTWCGISLWSVGSAVPALFPPGLLPTLSLLTMVTEWETERTLMLCKHCSATVEPLVCYPCWFSNTSKPQQPMGWYKEN